MNDINYILNGYPFLDMYSALINNLCMMDSNAFQVEWIKRTFCFFAFEVAKFFFFPNESVSSKKSLTVK